MFRRVLVCLAPLACFAADAARPYAMPLAGRFDSSLIETNVGQASAGFDFVFRTPDWRAGLSSDGIGFLSPASAGQIFMKFEHALSSRPVPGRQAGSLNLIGSNDPRTWQTGIPRCESVTYQNIYPGVDIRYLATAIDAYLDHYNERPKPFIWTHPQPIFSNK